MLPAFFMPMTPTKTEQSASIIQRTPFITLTLEIPRHRYAQLLALASTWLAEPDDISVKIQAETLLVEGLHAAELRGEITPAAKQRFPSGRWTKGGAL